MLHDRCQNTIKVTMNWQKSGYFQSLQYQTWIFQSLLLWFSELAQWQALIQNTLSSVVLKWTQKPWSNHAQFASKPFKQQQLHFESELLARPLPVTNAAHQSNGLNRNKHSKEQHSWESQAETFFFSKTFIWFDKNKRISSLQFFVQFCNFQWIPLYIIFAKLAIFCNSGVGQVGWGLAYVILSVTPNRNYTKWFRIDEDFLRIGGNDCDPSFFYLFRYMNYTEK